VAIASSRAPAPNALQASTTCTPRWSAEKSFPPGVTYRIVYDPTVYVRESINAVAHRCSRAILLVSSWFVVFLQTLAGLDQFRWSPCRCR